jgi:predicted TIM-barrel fold metal-dependent hydrolase
LFWIGKESCNSMVDNHVHIGQFNEIYYNPIVIAETVMEKCARAVFSSTTSCKKDASYKEIEREIKKVINKFPPEKMIPFFWVVPEYIKKGLSIEKIMDNFPYRGFKIHSRANHWDLNNISHLQILHNIFGYANTKKMPVLIHTGVDSIDEAFRFSKIFSEYKFARIVLAHARPLSQSISLIKSYPNIYCDTAFVDKKSFSCLLNAGLNGRIFLGSDFPITHYFNKAWRNKNDMRNIIKQYDNDIRNLYKQFKAMNRAYKITRNYCNYSNNIIT